MNKFIIKVWICFLLFAPMTLAVGYGQIIDTTIQVDNNQSMHLVIIKGTNPPILFESGLGNGADAWKGITKQIAEATGATVICYDRLSYGNEVSNYNIGFVNELKSLETGLSKLGYANKQMMLVAHSLGGMYAQQFAARNPNDVKAMVLIDDANFCSLNAYFNSPGVDKNEMVNKYILELLNVFKNSAMPEKIPVTDIVAVDHKDENGNQDSVWLKCHEDFVLEKFRSEDGEPNRLPRTLISANGVSHDIHKDNPILVFTAITSLYANTLGLKEKLNILTQSDTQLLIMANELKKNEIKCGKSEQDLTDWGYSYLEKGDTKKAIEIFKLYATLYPNAWNAYDCLAEAYLKNEQMQEAVKNYKKSLELNPKNDNAMKVLEKISK